MTALLIASAVGVLVAGGVYLLLRARSFEVVLGLTLLSYATNLLIFAAGRPVIGKPPILAQCGTSILQLTPYVHGTPPEAETHRYRVEVARSGGFTVTPLGAEAPCAAAPDADPAVHCTRSSQRVLAGG